MWKPSVEDLIRWKKNEQKDEERRVTLAYLKDIMAREKWEWEAVNYSPTIGLKGGVTVSLTNPNFAHPGPLKQTVAFHVEFALPNVVLGCGKLPFTGDISSPDFEKEFSKCKRIYRPI